MNFEYVETITKQNIKLFGCLSRKNNDKCHRVMISSIRV